jgi:hypothetical protein
MKLTRDPVKDPSARIRLRFLLATFGVFMVFGLGTAVVRADPKGLFLGVAMAAWTLPGFIPYVLLVHTRMGALLGGISLIAGVVGSLVWVFFVIEMDDGLETLWIPFIAWWTGVGVTLLEFIVFRPLDRSARKAPWP